MNKRLIQSVLLPYVLYRAVQRPPCPGMKMRAAIATPLRDPDTGRRRVWTIPEPMYWLVMN